MTEKLLFTPGPLTTSLTVKKAMLNDLGSRDITFIETVEWVRKKLLEITGLNRQMGYDTIIMQGSGTFGLESVTSSVIPKNGKLLVIVNGAYGERMVRIAHVHNIDVIDLVYEENVPPMANDVDQILTNRPEITHVSIVHCETTTGIMNDIESIGKVVKKHNKVYIVDAMSSFGAVPVDFKKCGIDYLVSSSNKCIEGVPGFSFVICRKEELMNAKDNARTLSLDLYAQFEGLEKNGQFRFTPPTHAIMAFAEALRELEMEGGVEGRAKRYTENHIALLQGMRVMGFKEYLEPAVQGYIITSFLYPNNPNFLFSTFYSLLSERGYVIYPGKLSKEDCFRIGNIGKINKGIINDLLSNIHEVLELMKVTMV